MGDRAIIRSTRVRQLLGNISLSTLRRIRANDSTFPRALDLNGRPQWYLDEIEAYLAARPRVTFLERKASKRAAPSAPQLSQEPKAA